MSRPFSPTKVVRVDLELPLRPLEIEERYASALLVVAWHGRVVGQVSVPAVSPLPADVQRAAIVRRLADAIWRAELERAFHAAVGANVRSRDQPSVSVVVCTRDRPDDLERCLRSLLLLEPAPVEIVVVDSAPTSDTTRALCADLPVRYTVEPIAGLSRARNRGILATTGDVIAFTDDDCVVDPAWLAGIGARLADPRVGLVTGVVVPLELETPAQQLFEARGGFGRGYARIVLDGAQIGPMTSVGRIGAGANFVVRRSAIERVGAFAEWLGSGTPAGAAEEYDLFCRLLAAGDRLVFDPEQIVWHRHRRDTGALQRTLFAYARGSTAYATQRVLLDGDLGAARILQWWWLRHLPRELVRIAARDRGRSELRLLLAEALGTLSGPFGLWTSRRSRRDVRQLDLPKPGSPVAAARPTVAREAGSVSVVVPTRDRAASLERLLRELALQSYPPERLEAVVVLDGTGDDSAAVASSLDVPYRVTVRALDRVGVGAARNAGTAAATGDIVVFLDDDVVPRPDCVERHAAAHRRGSPCVALGYAPPVVDGSWWGLALRAWWEDHFTRKADPGRTVRWSDVITLNSSFRRSLLLEHGGFDEQFARRHEDWELGVRLVEAGVRLRYVGDAVVAHELDCSFEAALGRQRQEARADVLLARRHPVVGRELPLVTVLGAGRETPRPNGDAATAAELERRGRRGAWRRLTRALLREAYLAGVRDELPTAEAVEELATIVAAVPPVALAVSLDGGGRPPRVPPIGTVELALEIDGEVVARVPPGPPGFPWDWDTALAQVEREASDELRAAMIRRLLASRAEAGPAEVEATHAS